MVCYIEDELLDSEQANAMLKIPAVGYDFVTSLCGEYLGSGQFRSVFDYALDDKYVIKIEPKNTNCNTIEYMMYNEIQYLQGDLSWVKDWFAPVKWISPNGRLLVMRKTKPHTDKTKKKRPDKIPKFLWDVKEENFGWIGNNYVCHDYGQLYNLIEYSKRMIKIDWDK
jgi:hypothetical protein